MSFVVRTHLCYHPRFDSSTLSHLCSRPYRQFGNEKPAHDVSQQVIISTVVKGKNEDYTKELKNYVLPFSPYIKYLEEFGVVFLLL